MNSLKCSWGYVSETIWRDTNIKYAQLYIYYKRRIRTKIIIMIMLSLCHNMTFRRERRIVSCVEKKNQVPTWVYCGYYYHCGERRCVSRRRRVIVGFSGHASKKIIFSRKCFTLSPSPPARHFSTAAAVGILPLVTLRFRKYNGRLNVGRLGLVTKSNFRTILFLSSS